MVDAMTAQESNRDWSAGGGRRMLENANRRRWDTPWCYDGYGCNLDKVWNCRKTSTTDDSNTDRSCAELSVSLIES